MGLWDIEEDEPDEEVDKKEDNPYLKDPVKGLKLLGRIISAHHTCTRGDEIASQINTILDNNITKIVSCLGKEARNECQKLAKLSSQISEYQKFRLLSRKTIIGLGGQFSAGKSCFINSCLGGGEDSNKIILPENQNPTTSIPTYIVGGSEEIIYAYCGNEMVALDHDALQAMTHIFFEEYQIGLSRFISNIVVHTPYMPEYLTDKVVFLDTPGYNKSDIDTQESLRDEVLAREQLKAVDFLIWLIDITNGTLHEHDVEFLKKIQTDTPVLIVANKADKVSESKQQEILSCIKETMKNKKINVEGIAAYSSYEGKEYSNGDQINKFLKKAVDYAVRKINILQESETIIRNIEEIFKSAISERSEKQKSLENDIKTTKDIHAMKSITSYYNLIRNETEKIVRKEKLFEDNVSELKKQIAEINL